MRDCAHDFKPLERLFGTLGSGDAFGESCLLAINEIKPKFFNALCLSDCIVLSIDRQNFDDIYQAQDKRHLNDKMNFIKSIPEFENQAFSTTKLKNFC